MLWSGVEALRLPWEYPLALAEPPIQAALDDIISGRRMFTALIGIQVIT